MQILAGIVRMLAAFTNFKLTSPDRVNNERMENMENVDIPQPDARPQQNVTTHAESQLNYYPVDNRFGHHNRICDPFVLSLGFNLITLIPRPLGRCAHCCRIKLRRDIQITLYTRATAVDGVAIKWRKGFLKRAGFDVSHPTVIYIHGFLETCGNQSAAILVKNAYLQRPEEYNVIIVNWTNLSAGPWYLHAAENTIIVANVLAKFIKFYHDLGELSIKHLHLIGFSLGAQTAGMTGKLLRSIGVVNRITGLDPALPLYPITDVDHRLAANDAEFVDVIHTSTSLLGYPVSIGDVDFYLNYGKDQQPGCSFGELVLMGKVDDYLSCSHERAFRIYAETVATPQMYPAFKCDTNGRNCDDFDNVYLGFNASRSARGDYFVNTN